MADPTAAKDLNEKNNHNALDADSGNSINAGRVGGNKRAVAGQSGAVSPVPHLSLVHPVPQAQAKIRASGSTKKVPQRAVHPVPRNAKPPGFTGYKWKPSGLTGWELYTRRPSISKNGKRSSTGDYLGYYSQEAVRILYEATEKTADARRA